MKDDKSLEDLGADAFKSANFMNLVNEMEANLAVYLKMAKISAKIRKAKYDAHIDEKFTPDQALAIVMGTQLLG